MSPERKALAWQAVDAWRTPRTTTTEINSFVLGFYTAITQVAPEAEPAAPVDARDALTDAQILKIAQQPETCPCYPWWLIGNVKVGDLQTAVLSFARAVLARQAAAPAEGVK